MPAFPYRRDRRRPRSWSESRIERWEPPTAGWRAAARGALLGAALGAALVHAATTLSATVHGWIS